eukprot:TRINITY_DN44536_c0_g1_i1.p1 TRINITY_DN44536_c0_g1~~TRINITY_DN44536_c0_g1_i1.p1  ORF type:complete len:877 (-),score=200.93 TRINITY_DN44536_c0_g1_i1:62-2692(-)
MVRQLLLALAVCVCCTAWAKDLQCRLQEKVIVGSGFLHNFSTDSATACCEGCYNYSGCIAFTFDVKKAMCFLKDNVYGATPHVGSVSGTVESRTLATRACHLPGHTEYGFCDTSLPLEARIEDLIGRLRPEEKAPLLTARESPLGSVPRLGIPEYDWGTNCIHGVQSRCGSKCPTSFPNPNMQGASWNRSLWEAMARVTGIELRALWLEDVGENHQDNLPHLGLDCWSPNININRDPRWGRNLETPGEDPYLNGQYGVWHTKGLQYGEDKRYLQAVVTLKHWDAYSLEDGGGKGAPTRHTFDAVISKADLAGTYFPAFKAAVREGGARGVMCSYNEVNGVPSCANKFLLQDVLRTAWNFSGYVSSDSGAVEDIYAKHHYKNMSADRGVAEAVKAGCDIDSSLDSGHASTGSPYTWHLLSALKQGLLEEADIDAALKRSLRLRFELGLFDPVADQPYWQYSVAEKVDTFEAQELNRHATRQGLVLLKNDPVGSSSEKALPLVATKFKIAVIGPHVNAREALVGNYLGQICPESDTSYSCVESPAEAMLRYNEGGAALVHVAEGCPLECKSDEGFADAIAAAVDAQAVVMFMGLDTSKVEREGHDRTELGLPGLQLQLIKEVVKAVRGQKPVIVVLINGGAVALDWLKGAGQTDAILEAFYPGKLGAEAIARTLFGYFSPGGKMPYSVMPESYTLDVDFFNMSMVTGAGRTYRFYAGEALWPFGYGLSYSQFRFKSDSFALPYVRQTGYGDDLNLEIHVEVHNIGGYSADEVVQAYFIPSGVHLRNFAPLPRKQLFDFQRVSLPPAQGTKVIFQVPCRALALADAKGNLVSAPGKYQLLFTNGVDETIERILQLSGEEQIIEEFPKLHSGSGQHHVFV